MEEMEMILGYAKYDGEEYPFTYEKGILNLLPSTKMKWEERKSSLLTRLVQLSNQKQSDEWVPHICINGITNKGNNIVFISKDIKSNDNGFIQYGVGVIYEYDSNSSNSGMIEGLIIKADEIDYFFNPSQVFESEITLEADNGVESILVKSGGVLNRTEDCGSYNSGDTSVKIDVSAYSQYYNKSENPLVAQSQMCLEFSKAINLDKALEIISEQQLFLRYICYRKNINVKSIDVIRRNEKRLREKIGKISVIGSHDVEPNQRKKNEILSWELLEGKISPIFQEIAEDKVYFGHFCECIDKRNSYDVARIILIFVAFEREYNNFFSSDDIRSPKYFKVKGDILSLLDNYREGCNSKARGYIDSFKKTINYNDNSLGNCIENAIQRNMEVMEIFLNSHYQSHDKKTIENIAKRLGTMRNQIAHGSLELEIVTTHLSDLKVLEGLVYAMRLSSMGIGRQSVQRSVCKLLRYSIAIPASH